MSESLPLLHSSQNVNYFGSAQGELLEYAHPSIRRVAQLLSTQGLIYLGKLTSSQFSHVEVYAYATTDRCIAVSVMAVEAGLGGIDCVSKFADRSFLTTTTTKIINDAYDEQKLYRASFPNLEALELLEQHRNYFQDFEDRYGKAQPIFTDLLAIAQMVDEYTTRQQSNFGHGFLQVAGGFAQAQVAGMMGDDDSISEDTDSEDEEYEEKSEYDLDSVSLLIRAILQDDLAQVETLLAEGVNLNPNGWEEAVPLVAAVYRGNPDMINRLIAAGANLDGLDFKVYARPLGMAIKQNRPDLIKLLLDAGASPEGGSLEDTGLSLAINQNNLAILQMLLEAGADPNSGMEDDYRVIMSAALQGRLEMVKLLVDSGADVSAWSQGETAIKSAARNCHREVYDYLYPLVDEETRRYADRHGEKEFTKAAKRKAREANKLGEKLGDAAVFGKFSEVQKLLAQGADPNIITECGKSPLMLAAMYGHINIMSALLDAGADPNLLGDEEYDKDMTALMYIASSYFVANRAEVIKLLAARGANLNVQDIKGRTALIIAGSNTDAVKALIDLGADLNLRDRQGNTAMMLGTFAVQSLLRKAGASEDGLNDVALVEAAGINNLSKVEELLKTGVNVNYADGSALVAAAGKGYLAMVERLIEAGADVNLGWKTGFTPIASAAYQGYLNIVERLLAAGADPFQRTFDDEGRDALDYARTGKYEGHHDGKDHAAIIALLESLKASKGA